MQTKVSKSWGVTLTAFILAILAPIMDGPLADYGIDISEKDVEHFLYMMLGIGATGVAAGGTKKVIAVKRKNSFRETEILKNIETLVKEQVQKEKTGATDPGQQPKKPKVDGMQDHGWYSTNMEYKEHTGAVISKDDAYLMIRVPDATVVSGTIKKDDNIIQADQGTDTLKFELLRRSSGAIEPITGEMEFNFKAYVDDRWRGADGRFTVL